MEHLYILKLQVLIQQLVQLSSLQKSLLNLIVTKQRVQQIVVQRIILLVVQKRSDMVLTQQIVKVYLFAQLMAKLFVLRLTQLPLLHLVHCNYSCVLKSQMSTSIPSWECHFQNQQTHKSIGNRNHLRLSIKADYMISLHLLTYPNNTSSNQYHQQNLSQHLLFPKIVLMVQTCTKYRMYLIFVL